MPKIKVEITKYTLKKIPKIHQQNTDLAVIYVLINLAVIHMLITWPSAVINVTHMPLIGR